ncbi:hypothetical protein PV726_36935 [Streptomyces europaeiscabiei]|nr:hypothetical protein [Streptomyces europaeiscabiei]
MTDQEGRKLQQIVRRGSTPAHASWANLIEARFGLLRQLTVTHSNHRNHAARADARPARLDEWSRRLC